MSNKIILGEEQVEGIECMIDFLDTDRTGFSLTGYAGVGKSFLVKHLIDYLEDEHINYALVAPTHKAKLVLEKFTHRTTITLHKLLSLRPNLNILELDLNDLRFIPDKLTESFIYNGVIICDESSMVNDALFDLLMDKAKHANTKVIFVGDSGQIKPVGSTYLSKVFNLEDNYSLTTIYRQNSNSGLNQTLTDLRVKEIKTFEESIGEDGSLLIRSTPKDFFMSAMPSFRDALSTKDILKAKFMSYTNKRVEAWNAKAKQVLFGGLEAEFNKHEFITCRENLQVGRFNLWNSMDYVIVEEPRQIEVNIPLFGKLPGWRLVLYDAADSSFIPVSVLSNKIDLATFNLLAKRIEESRLDALNARYFEKARFWKQYYKMIESFTSPFNLYYAGRLVRKRTFIGGYACTIHLSQGSSIQNVFIDMPSVYSCPDKEQIRQLQYVGLSRTTKDAYILQT